MSTDVYLWDETRNASDIVLRTSAAAATGSVGGIWEDVLAPQARTVRKRQRLRYTVTHLHQPSLIAPQTAATPVTGRHGPRIAATSARTASTEVRHALTLTSRTQARHSTTANHAPLVIDRDEELLLLIAAS